jgi:FlaA1/EpsC-like NDP-sugar epimerase
MSSTKQYPKPPFPSQDTGKPPGLERPMAPRPDYKGSIYKAAGKLKGQVALITGGDSGIGRSVAVLFAREGAKVVITFLPEEKEDAAETVLAIEEAGSEGLSIVGDVRDADWCRATVEQTIP